MGRYTDLIEQEITEKNNNLLNKLLNVTGYDIDELRDAIIDMGFDPDDLNNSQVKRIEHLLSK
jgi:hypothetical protein